MTASHNPKQWNALKLLNGRGEFLTAADGAQVLELAEKENFEYADVDLWDRLQRKIIPIIILSRF